MADETELLAVEQRHRDSAGLLASEMRYSNLSSAQVQKHFSSSDFTFRETTLAAALREAGLTEGTHLVREPKIEGVLSDLNDITRLRPSVYKVFHSHA